MQMLARLVVTPASWAIQEKIRDRRQGNDRVRRAQAGQRAELRKMLKRIEEADQVENDRGIDIDGWNAEVLAMDVDAVDPHAMPAGMFQERTVAITDVQNVAAGRQSQPALNKSPAEGGHLVVGTPVVLVGVVRVVHGRHAEIGLEDMPAARAMAEVILS